MIKYLILGFILGGAVMIVIYETFLEKKEKVISLFLAPKIEALIEESSMRIAEKQKNEKRKLTEQEKNKIFDECYNEKI